MWSLPAGLLCRWRWHFSLPVIQRRQSPRDFSDTLAPRLTDLHRESGSGEKLIFETLAFYQSSIGNRVVCQCLQQRDINIGLTDAVVFNDNFTG